MLSPFLVLETKTMGEVGHMFLIPSVVLYVGGEGSDRILHTSPC